jgi:uncharacterized membrane protein
VFLTAISKLEKAIALPAPSLLIVGSCAGELASTDQLHQILQTQEVLQEPLAY